MVGKKNFSHANLSDPADFSLVLRIANLSNYVKAAKSKIIISLENISSELRKTRGSRKGEKLHTSFLLLSFLYILLYQNHFLFFITHNDPNFCSLSKQEQPLTYVSLFRNPSRTSSTQKRKGESDTFRFAPRIPRKKHPEFP